MIKENCSFDSSTVVPLVLIESARRKQSLAPLVCRAKLCLCIANEHLETLSMRCNTSDAHSCVLTVSALRTIQSKSARELRAKSPFRSNQELLYGYCTQRFGNSTCNHSRRMLAPSSPGGHQERGWILGLCTGYRTISNKVFILLTTFCSQLLVVG